uniref:Envelope protein n=1 Tax=Chionoecetes opilio bacilliform virus TaxID=1825681 RepID=A0A1Q3DL06_9VIRU|nr:envelope protein [Chionoecetes opilio bacilliform virus]
MSGIINRNSIDTPMPLDKVIQNKLAVVLFYTPAGYQGLTILQKLLERFAYSSSSHETLFLKAGLMFAQHTGALMSHGCFLLALEIVDDDNSDLSEVDRLYFKTLLEPVRRWMMASGGRPNINIRVTLHEGNNNPAFGFHGPIDNDRHHQDTTSGLPRTTHHVILHDKTSKLNFSPRLLIKIKSFPPTHSAYKEEVEEEEGKRASLKQYFDQDPLMKNIETMSTMLSNNVVPSSSDLIEHVNNYTMNCRISIFIEHYDDMLLFEDFVRANPLQFLIRCVLAGPSL